MSIQLVAPIIYFLGVIALTQSFHKMPLARRFVYGFCLHIILSTAFAYVLNLFFSTYVSAIFVFGMVLIISLIFRLFSARIFPHVKKDIQYSSLVPVLIVFLFTISYLTNIYIHSQKGVVIPIVGNNDDTATHLSMSIMTIKEGSLLFKNRLLQELIKKGVDYQNAAYYPPTVYTYVALLYSGLFLGGSSFLDLPLLFNVYASFSFLIFLIFIFCIFDLAYGIVKSISIWSFVPVLVFGVFFVAGEYFVILYRMSYLSQILGNAFVLILYRMVIDMVQGSKNLDYSDAPATTTLSQLVIGAFFVGVGMTYYLFLPIALAVLPFILLPGLMSPGTKATLVGVPFWVLISKLWVICVCAAISVFPLVLYALSYSLVEQISIPGINLIIMASLIQFCLMTLAYVVIRRYIHPAPYFIGLTGGLVSLVVVFITTVPSMIKTGQLPYYFYKSFFTSGSFAVAYGIVVLCVMVSQSVRHLHRHGLVLGLTMKLAVWVILPMGFVIYLYHYNTFIPGYKSITYLAQGMFNYYPHNLQEKLFSMYKKHHDKKIAVYNPGYWGENILLFSLFENIPQAHVDGTKAKWFYFSSNPEFYFKALTKDYQTGDAVYIFDGHATFRSGSTK